MIAKMAKETLIMYILLCALLLAPILSSDAQYVKSVKGGGGFRGGYQYNPEANLQNFYGNSSQSHQYGGYGTRNFTNQGTQNLTSPINYEIGVCYIEVPTASLAKNPSHVPAGNGSRPDLSRIRSCCKGYIRNIHNYRICDPVCTNECVNALCTAPETCTCFPDHIMNLAGFCIPTCPIGCQNGHCSGGECLCKSGYKYDVNGKFCIPTCKENCGGQGNCTEPNVCACKDGFQSTSEGSCQPVCKNCTNGLCVAPNVCQCNNGYQIGQNSSKCLPICSQSCGPNGRCVLPNVCDYPRGENPNISPVYNPSHDQNPLLPGSQVVTQNPKHDYPSSPKYPGQYSPSNPGPGAGINTVSSPGQRYPGYPYPNQPGSNSIYPYLPSIPSNGTYPGQQGSNNSTHPGQFNVTNPGQVKPNYPSYPSQSESNNPYYPGRPGSNNYPYPGQPGSNNYPYPGQPGSNNPLYPGSNNSLYPGSNNPPYPGSNNTPYPGQPGSNQPFYPSQPGSNNPHYPGSNNTSYPGQPGSNQPIYPSQPGSSHPSYPGPHGSNSPSYPGQSGSNSPVYPGQQESVHSGHNRQSDYQGQSEHQGQSGYYGQSGHRGQSGYYGHTGYQEQSGYHSQSGYNEQSENQTLLAYNHRQQGERSEVEPYYPGSQMYPGNQQISNVDNIYQCSEECINGICIDGNRCQCNPGYVLDRNDPTERKCLPHCAGGCNNGVCSGPNFCICNVGYYKDHSVKGRPSCVKRIRRSIDTQQINPAEILVFDIPVDE